MQRNSKNTSGVTEVTEFALFQKWILSGHITRKEDNTISWSQIITECQYNSDEDKVDDRDRNRDRISMGEVRNQRSDHLFDCSKNPDTHESMTRSSLLTHESMTRSSLLTNDPSVNNLAFQA